MGIDGERDAHLSDGEIEAFQRAKPGVGIQHFDFAFVRQVDFGFIGHYRCDFSFDADSGGAHLKASGLFFRLVLVFAT